jgi:hypothetical protein
MIKPERDNGGSVAHKDGAITTEAVLVQKVDVDLLRVQTQQLVEMLEPAGRDAVPRPIILTQERADALEGVINLLGAIYDLARPPETDFGDDEPPLDMGRDPRSDSEHAMGCRYTFDAYDDQHEPGAKMYPVTDLRTESVVCTLVDAEADFVARLVAVLNQIDPDEVELTW